MPKSDLAVTELKLDLQKLIKEQLEQEVCQVAKENLTLKIEKDALLSNLTRCNESAAKQKETINFKQVTVETL